MGKYLILIISTLFSLTAVADETRCNSEVVTWPVGVNKSCGDQLWANGGLEVGSSYVAIDALNSSDATFVCDRTGWVYARGSCNISRDYKCVWKQLNRFDKNLFQDWSVKDVEFNLNSSSPHPKVVEFTNLCDQRP